MKVVLIGFVPNLKKNWKMRINMFEILLVIATMCQFNNLSFRNSCQKRMLDCVDKNTKSGVGVLSEKAEALEQCMKTGAMVQ